MRRFWGLMIVLLSATVGILYLMMQQHAARIQFARFQDQDSFSSVQEMTYQAIGAPWFGDGIVLYQPTFPKLGWPMTVAKIRLIQEADTRTIRLEGITLPVDESLRQHDSATVVARLRDFNPDTDLFTRPLETLAVLNQSVFKGDLTIEMHPQNDKLNLTLTLSQGGKPTVRLHFLTRQQSDSSLWGWVRSPLIQGQAEVVDIPLMSALAGYYAAASLSVPSDLTRSLRSGTPYVYTFSADDLTDLAHFLR